MNNQITSIIVLKMQYRQLYEEMSKITDKDKLDAFLSNVKKEFETGTLTYPCSEQALNTFEELWMVQNGTAKRPIAVRTFIKQEEHEKIIKKVAEEKKENKKIYITYRMCTLLASSILMLIKIHETETPEYIYSTMKEKVQNLAKIALESNPDKSAQIIYHELNQLQLNIIKIFSQQ